MTVAKAASRTTTSFQGMLGLMGFTRKHGSDLKLKVQPLKHAVNDSLNATIPHQATINTAVPMTVVHTS